MPKISKAVVIEFQGGFKDGRRISSASDDPDEVQDALFHYLAAGEGVVGKRLRYYSDAGLRELEGNIEIGPDGRPRNKREPVFAMNHVYEVAGRVEDDDSITIRYIYRGKLQIAG